MPRKLLSPNECKLQVVRKDMLDRCYNPHNKGFENYGARGIYVCEEWKRSLSAFRAWAKQSGYKPDLFIERKENNGPYSPDNCIWATRKEQNANRSITRKITAFGETKTLRQWSEDPRCELSYTALNSKVARGTRDESAFIKRTNHGLIRKLKNGS